MANILSFIEVSNIAGVRIKVDDPEGKFINVHMQYRCIINLRACAEVLFYGETNM